MSGHSARPRNRSIPDCAIIPELAYGDVIEAATWLCDAFGFTRRLTIGQHRVQLQFGDGAIVVTEREPNAAGVSVRTHATMVRVARVDDHHRRARQAGARILRPPADYPYGERQYSAEDIGGHLWTFTETIADSDPAAWGGVLH